MESPRVAIEDEFARILLPLARRWRGEADRAMARFGLSDATCWALVHILRLGDGVRQGDLAAAIDIRGASLVRLIDQLETAGLAERCADAQDRRVNRVSLTHAGRTKAGEIEAALGAIRREMFAGIGDGDLAVANAVLARLAARATERQSARQGGRQSERRGDRA